MATQADLDVLPQATAGTAKFARDNAKQALLAINGAIQPEEQEDYDNFCTSLLTALAPVGPVEEVTADEFVRCAWRLRRCAFAEETLFIQVGHFQAEQNKIHNTDYRAADPMLYPEYLPTQNAIDRTRSSTHIALCRAKADLDKMQTARRLKSPSGVRAKAQRAAVLQFEPKSDPAAGTVIPQPRKPLPATAGVSKGRVIAMPSIPRKNSR